jgi:beta-D-xylosidase 4
MQGDEAANGYLKVSACLKHYAAYSLEGDCPGPSCRESFPAVVTAQDMEDTYLPAFQAGVERGRASGLMCSYNAETYGYGTMGNGTQGGAVPSCANKYIMNDLARDEWGFVGYITSDCNAVNDVWNGGADPSAGGHHYVNNAPDTVKATFSAGMDTDCHGSMQRGRGLMTPTLMLKLLETDPAVEAMGDTALKHLFAVQFRLGFADPAAKVPWSTWDETYVNTPAAQQLAAEAASQSIVLLKNERTLPLKTARATTDKAMTLAVLGRNANATSNMQGNYFGTAPFLISPVAGIDKYATTVYSDGVDTEAAVKLVADADAVVLVVGLLSDCSLEGKRAPGAACALGKSDEAEGHDRTSLLLPGNQDALITDVATAASKKGVPVVLVVMSGGQIDISEHQANPHIGAIVWCGYPGQSGGAAIADVVFGKTNPAGRLTLTWYKEDFTKQVKATDMGMRPSKTSPGRSYRFFTGEPLYHFGHGLSFTSFAHKLHMVGRTTLDSSVIEAAGHAHAPSHGPRASGALSLSSLSKTTVLSLECNTTNIGFYDGAEVIMVFAAPPGAGVGGRPLKSLVDFDRVFLTSSSSVATRFDITAQHLTVATAQGEAAVRREAAIGSWRFWVGVDGQDDAVTLNVV